MASLFQQSCRQRCPRGHWPCCAVAVLLSFVATPVAAQQASGTSGSIRPGDIVVVTHNFQLPSDVGTLVKVDPSTGAETTLSDFADPAQGPVAQPRPGLPPFFAATLVVPDASSVFVDHSGFDGFFRVGPTTGARTIISDAALSAVEPSGNFLAQTESTIVRIDRLTGAKTTVSDFGDPAQGPVTGLSRGMAVERTGHIIVRGDDGSARHVTLFRVDPVTGARTLLSDFDDPVQAQIPTFPQLLIDHSGDVLLLDLPHLSPLRIVRVDAVTGERVTTAGFSCAALPGMALLSAALDQAGDVLVVLGGDEALPHALFRLDATTGECRFVRPSTGEVAVVPTPLVNGMVSLSVTGTSFEPTAGNALAPSGVFRISATLTNESSVPLRTPFFRVAELSGGNRLITGDRPADLIRLGGKGTRQTPHAGDDGVIAPGESIVVEFGIGLETRAPFTFFVDVFGEPHPEDSQ
jgi:hypothetical protein